MEVFLQFFIGFYTHELKYFDDICTVARHNLSSPFGFWFDSVTSIPFSYIDLSIYLVPIFGRRPLSY